MEYHAILVMKRWVSGSGTLTEVTEYKSGLIRLEPGNETRSAALDLMMSQMDPMMQLGGGCITFFNVQPNQLPTSEPEPDYLDDIMGAVDKFERDLGFTAPELTSMRIGQLRERICAILGGEGDEDTSPPSGDLPPLGEPEAGPGHKARRYRCVSCKQVKPADQVPLRENPFEAEVNDNHARHRICDSCASELSDDI